ncbi:CIS tube protein [Streptomyces netropsis]
MTMPPEPVNRALGQEEGPARAELVIFEPPTGSLRPAEKISSISFPFNPPGYTLGKRASLARTPARTAPEAAGAEYLGAGPRAMSVEVYLDGDPGEVERDVEILLSCLSPTRASVRAGRPSAPWVQLYWGTNTSVSFPALVTHVEVHCNVIETDGRAKRANCKVYLEEVGGAVPRQNPTSGGAGALREHRLVQGECLALVAWQAYQDPVLWRAVARANGVDDPLAGLTGRVLVVPGVESAGADR